MLKRRYSIAPAVFGYDVSTRHVPLPEDPSAAAGKVGPMFWLSLHLCRNNARNYTLTLAQFYRLPCAQQLLQAAGVTQLPNIYGWHISYCGTLCATSQAIVPHKPL